MDTDYIKISDKTMQIVNSINKSGYIDYTILNKDNKVLLKNELTEIYNNGFGFKLIAKALNLSYTQCRRLLIKYLDIETRKGCSIVTDRLRKIRSINAIAIGRFNNWPQKNPEMQKYNQRGIQGYYWNKCFNKYVWLRSSYEYIYAKWLDSKNIIWDTEVKYYVLENNIKYLPDFFIYNEDKTTIKYVVEIKGEYKVYDRSKQEKFTELPIITVRNIELFLAEGSSKCKELRKWKLVRKLSKE